MIDTDKYKTKKNRNWELKVTEQENDFNYEDIIAVDSLGKESYTVAQMVDTGLEDAQLIADAPLLLEEVKRLRKIEQEHGRVIIDDWEHKPLGDADAYPLPYVTVYHGGCEYVGLLRLHKNEDGEVIE